MKKMISLVLALLLMSCLALSASAEAGTATGTVSLSSTTVSIGDTITVTYNISSGVPTTILTLNPEYCSTCYEVVRGEYVTSNAEAARYSNKAFAAYTAGEILMTGTCTLTLKVKSGACGHTCGGVIGGSLYMQGKDPVKITAKATVNHKWGDWTETKPATCKEVGTEERTCAECGKEETEPIEMLPHTESDWVTKAEATCDAAGEKVKTCTVCNKELETEQIPAKGHDLVYTNKDDVNHTVTCTRCDYSADEAHTFGDWVIVKEPSCVDGERKHTCQLCGAQVTETIAATGKHVFSGWTKTDGETHTGTCTGCNAETKTEPHTWDKVETTKEATCKEKGVKTYTCKCGATKTEEIPLSTVHTYDDKWTDSGDGKNHEQVCTVCGGAKKAEAHTTEEKITKNATCVDKGEKIITCKKCTYKVTEVTPVDPDAHKFDDNWVDYGDGKNHERICTLCKTASELAAHKYTAKYEDKKDGKTHIAYCVCGASVGEKHDYHVNGEVIEKPTTSKEGKQEILCVCGAKIIKTLPKKEADLDDVPRTGDITNPLVLDSGAVIAMLACAWYLLRRKTVK